MECPLCQAWVAVPGAECPRCGARLHDAGATEGTAGVVEGTAQRGPVSAELPLPDGDMDATGARMTGDGSRSADTRLMVRSSALPAVLWRQPAVRAVAQAGAGAIALGLGVRLLRAWLAHPRAVRTVTSSALPTLGDLLQAVNGADGEVPGRERGGDVVETFVYMRRVVRRR
jgi:hypothetical protein